MKFLVFGKMIEVVQKNNRWNAFYVGPEGKKRPASDLVIPPELEERELLNYITDLCHEWETKSNNKVEILK